jgi:hypothetical protein
VLEKWFEIATTSVQTLVPTPFRQSRNAATWGARV